MFARWRSGFSAFAVLGGLVGCSSTGGPNLRTPMAERFALPPSDDPRFSQPIAYPKDTLNQDQVIKPNGNNSKLPSQAPPMTQSPGRNGVGSGAGMTNPGF